MSGKLKWGILSTGLIAQAFARDLQQSRTGTLLGIASRTEEGAGRFAAEFGVPKTFGSYEALLADPEIEAVYIAPLHPMHAEWAIAAARAGKHILCEKPMGMNAGEALSMVEEARRQDVFLMEAFMYRLHPQIHKMIGLLQEKIIGEVRLIEAAFSFTGQFALNHRILDPQLGGGGILDVGCYCASAARLIAGVAVGKKISEPEGMACFGHIGSESRVDEYTVASLRFPGEILAQLVTGVQLEHEEGIRIYGTEGHLALANPWLPEREEWRKPVIRLQRSDESEPREILVLSDRPLYALEADHVAERIPDRQAAWPAMTWEDSLGNARMLDRWLAEIGMSYPLTSAIGGASTSSPVDHA
jgi:predicted dehydrogenase